VEVTRLMNLSFQEPDLKIEKGGDGKAGTPPSVPSLMVIIAAILVIGIVASLVFVWKKRAI